MRPRLSQRAHAWRARRRARGALPPLRVGLVAAFPPQPGGVPAFAGWLLEQESALGCEFHCFDLWRPASAGGGGRLSLRAVLIQTWNLLRLLVWALRAPRLVHYCASANPTGLARDIAFLALLRLSRRRTIVHVHSGTDVERLTPLRLYRAALRTVSWLAAQLVTVGPGPAAALRTAGVEASFVLNPARLGAGQPATGRQPQPGRLRVLFVGSLCREKGCFELLSAVAALHETGPDVRLVLAGREKHRGEEAALRRHCEALGIGSAVTFAGFLDSDSLVRAYSHADVLCLPSWREGLPLAVLEAMALGVPVVATRTGAIPDVVVDGVSGLLVPPGDVEALASVLRTLADDMQLRRQLAAGAYSAGAAHASADRLAAEWRTLYRAVLAEA